MKGNGFDRYVQVTKLKLLDEAGQLELQEPLPTPDILGKKFVKPDFTIQNSRGGVAAYADAKTGSSISFDGQAQGLVQWSTTTTSKTLIYYVPDAQAVTVSPNLVNAASTAGVTVRIIQVR